ncbi:MAG: VOC family protein [Chlorobi bacterium]|nr:VOC family protein [Chlorobiota bacterium]
MKTMNAYLIFPGTCEEALNFYQNSIGGEIPSLMRFSDAPMPVAEENAQRVMHAEFRCGDIYFMASDSMPENPDSAGSNVRLSIALDDAAEQERMFNALSDGGTVEMALADTFWGARFGMLTDRYGINWMLNYELPKENA